MDPILSLAEALIVLETYSMAFGTGARSCPGKRTFGLLPL
jgi:hypothetical protein